MKLVTVLMPVYNGESFVAEAIESILGQTASDLELLIVDDGSTDRSAEVCRDYRDPRIRLIQNEANLGIVASLNRGLDLAAGVYVARMDSDDISLPERLEKQLRLLDEDPEVAVCGAGTQAFGARDLACSIPPTDDGALRTRLVFAPPFSHPTVMLRAETLTRFGLRYDAGFPHAEDYDLWTRFPRQARLEAVPEVLLRYRLHEASVGHAHAAAQAESARRIRRGQLGALGIQPSAYEEVLHTSLAQGRYKRQRFYLDAVRVWFGRLEAENRRSHHVPEEAFATYLAAILSRIESARGPAET